MRLIDKVNHRSQSSTLAGSGRAGDDGAAMAADPVRADHLLDGVTPQPALLPNPVLLVPPQTALLMTVTLREHGSHRMEVFV